MTRTEIINELINKNGYTSYLEIGLANPNDNYVGVVCETKECVDPDPYSEIIKGKIEYDIPDGMLTYEMTSDKMFETVSPDKKWDLIFIDGLHTQEQCMIDIKNSLMHLNENGIVMCHDNLPFAKWVQLRVRRFDSPWTGDVWKTQYSLIKNNPGIDINIVSTDFGCSIMRYVNPETVNFNLVPVEYEQVFCDMETLVKSLNVINVEQFKEKYL